MGSEVEELVCLYFRIGSTLATPLPYLLSAKATGELGLLRMHNYGTERSEVNEVNEEPGAGSWMAEQSRAEAQ